MEQSLSSIPKSFFVANCVVKHSKPNLRRRQRCFCTLIFTISLFLAFFDNAAKADLSNERFGKISIFREPAEPNGVILLFSDEKGFDLIAETLAQKISKKGFLVVGIDTPRYIQGIEKEDAEDNCSYLAGEITRLSQSAQSTAKLEAMKKPILFGIGQGAAVAYAIAAQYPFEFAGLATLNFCPTLRLKTLLCAGEGLKSERLFADKIEQSFSFLSKLQIYWDEFSVEGKSSCLRSELLPFTKINTNQTSIALTYSLDSSDLSMESLDKLLLAFNQLSDKGQEQQSDLEEAVSDLPLIEELPEKTNSNVLVMFISGDGGWAEIDKELAGALNSQGVRVIGFNALRYFWNKKTPEETADDINRALRFYRTKLGIEKIILAGFSFGADIVPFVVNRLSADNKSDVLAVVLLSPGKKTDFEIKIGDWLGMTAAVSAYDISAEIRHMSESKVLCIYGAEDEDQGCSVLDPQRFQLTKLAGDHHFDGDYQRVSELILATLK